MPPSWSRSPSSDRVAWLDGVWVEPAGPGPAPSQVDGIHDVIRVRDGRCEFGAEHIDRLIGSAASLALPLPVSRSNLLDALFDVLRANPPGDQFLVLQVFRAGGEAGRVMGSAPATSIRIESAASIRIESEPFTGHAARPMSEGFRLATAPFPRDERSPSCRHKMLIDERVRLARAFARESGMDEVIFRNTAGRIAGAAGANLLLVRAGTLVTPPLEEGAFPGVVRGAVLRAARDIGLVPREVPVEPAEILATAEVFLTGTRLGLAPVAEVDGVALPPPTARASIPKLRMRFREIAAERGLSP